MKLKNLIERHPLAAYFCLAFGISWGGSLLIVELQGYRIETGTWSQAVVWYFAMITGPILACLLLTAVLKGRRGLKDLFYRLIRWRVGPHWYAISVLTNPLIVLATLTILALLISPVYRPIFDPRMFLFGLGAGIFEEIGWTGFATPWIASRKAWFPAAVGFGLLHGIWHMPVDFLGSSYTMGAYWLPFYLVFWIGGLAAYRVFMMWVYQHTKIPLLGILMHTVFTGSFLVFCPALSPAELMTWGIVYTVSLWLIVAVLALSGQKILSQKLIEAHE
jgi:hypothetical protein